MPARAFDWTEERCAPSSACILRQEATRRYLAARMGAAFSAASQGHELDLSFEDEAQHDDLAGMPPLWLDTLVTHYLGSHERLCLFRVCKRLAAATARHCTWLTLQPTSALQDSKRRAWVLSLAARCSNVHLHLHGSSLKGYCMAVDMERIWPCITQVTLCDVCLTSNTIRNLHLEQLTQLHTLSLTSTLQLPNARAGFRHHDKLDVAALSRIVNTGGLTALRTLHCSCSSTDDAHATVSKLAPVLGNLIAQFVVQGNAMGPVQSLGCWPAALRVTINRFSGGVQFAAIDSGAFPQVSHFTLPGTLRLGSDEELGGVMRQCSWEMLELSGLTSDAVLMSLPVQGVQHLRVRGIMKVQGNPTQQRDTVENLARCDKVELAPLTWERNIKWGVDPKLPVFEVIAYPLPLPEAFSWFMQRLQGTAIKLTAQGKITPSDAAVLSHVAEHIQVLWLNEWQLAPTCTWQQVLAYIPRHVTHLILGSCKVSKNELLDAIHELQPPAGLKQLTLSYCAQRVDNSWVQLATNDAEVVQQALDSTWPGVRVHISSY